MAYMNNDNNVFTRKWPLSCVYYSERRAFRIFREMFGCYVHKISPIYYRGI